MTLNYEIPAYFRSLNSKQLLQFRDILYHAGYYLPLPQVKDRLKYGMTTFEVCHNNEENKQLTLRSVSPCTINIANDMTTEELAEHLDGYVRYYHSQLNWADTVTLTLHGASNQLPLKYTGLTNEFRSWAMEYTASSGKSTTIRYAVEVVSSYSGILSNQNDIALLCTENKIQWTSEKPYWFYPITNEKDSTDHMIVRDLLTRLFFIEDTAFVVVDETNVTRDYHDAKTLKTIQDTVIQLYSIPPIELIDSPMKNEIKYAIVEAYFGKLSRYVSVYRNNFAVAMIDERVIDSATLYGTSILESYSYELLKYPGPYPDISNYHLGIRLFGPDILLELLEQ